MVTFAQLRDAQPALWTAAGHGWSDAANHSRQCADDIHDRGVKQVEANWADRVGELAKASLVDLANKFDSGYDEMRGAMMVVDGFTQSISALQTELNSVVATAAKLGVVLTPEGKIDPALTTTPAVLDLIWVINEVTSVLDRATQTDSRTAEALGRIRDSATNFDPGKAVNEVQIRASHDQLDIIAADIPTGKSPNEVADWWKSISPEQQQQLMLAQPTTIASLDGIPADVKDGLHGSGPYDPIKAVQWAEEHYSDGKYDGGTLFEDNCTEFASQVLKHGGLPEKNNGWGLLDDDNWLETTDTGVKDIDEHTRTPAWDTSPGLHDFLTNNGGQQIPLASVKPGDVIFFQQDAPNPDPSDSGRQQGMFHHTAIVTAVTPDGDIRYTQQSDNQHDLSLNGRDQNLVDAYGNQTIVAVRVNG